MGLKACYTEHSLFGFADAASIHMNKVVKFSMSDIDHGICVSHTGCVVSYACPRWSAVRLVYGLWRLWFV